jgi:hypothetical protein
MPLLIFCCLGPWRLTWIEGQLLNDARSNLRKAAAGFLRTHRYLTRHKSDFHLAQQDSLCLTPKVVDWASFCHFTPIFGNLLGASVQPEPAMPLAHVRASCSKQPSAL